MKSRKGKIARLPEDIRLQLNSQLRNGEDGPTLLRWLNSLPEVQAVLAKKFNGEPIKRQNLSAWRKGGYRDWKLLREIFLARTACQAAGQPETQSSAS